MRIMKFIKKASPSFCPFLEASNISGYSQSIVAIEVAFLFQISSCIYYKGINFIGFELQTLCCWKYQACLEVAPQITHINNKKKHSHTKPIKKNTLQLKDNLYAKLYVCFTRNGLFNRVTILLAHLATAFWLRGSRVELCSYWVFQRAF